MEVYVAWVQEYPNLSAAIQFAILGTLGEVIGACIRARGFALPCTLLEGIGKMFAWALLGLIIHAGFVGMVGFTDALLGKGLLPAFCEAGIGHAFAVSLLTNVIFGPHIMLFHRVEDNVILRRWSFAGIDKALWALLWFWIPAHTLTFSLPTEFRIGLAAVWGVVLGVILGLSMPKKK